MEKAVEWAFCPLRNVMLTFGECLNVLHIVLVAGVVFEHCMEATIDHASV